MKKIVLFVGMLVLISSCPDLRASAPVDLGRAVVVSRNDLAATEKKAVALLIEEINRRTGLTLRQQSTWPKNEIPVIFLETIPGFTKKSTPFPLEFNSAKATLPKEGYRLRIDLRVRKAPTVLALGNDSRGLLFAIGHLLRSLDFAPEGLRVSPDLQVITAPKYPVRGVQLAYRPLPNTYDKWELADFEQYVRDLIVFGANSIEIHPGFADEQNRNAFMKTAPDKMMRDLSKMVDSYGLDLWMWYPALDGDYADSVVCQKALAKWRTVFRQCKRLDQLFVPGGDPGDTHPKILLPFLAEVAQALKKHHPKAGLWISPQGFNQERLKYFYNYVQQNQPEWLAGVVFGPWVKTSLPALRAAIPEKYPIRRYPDITHCVRCQYPVPNWDQSFARTLGREPINPMPIHQARIHQALAKYAVGSIGYSEGVHDDVNKFIWLALDWNPDLPLRDILRQYVRYFMPGSDVPGIVQGLLDLEKNWIGQLISSRQVPQTLGKWQSLEQQAAPLLKQNWRFQMGLLRAYYDAFIQRRLIFDTELEARVDEMLRQAGEKGPAHALNAGLKILSYQDSIRVAEDWRTQIESLGEQLFHNIGMQLSVEKYGAKGAERGAVLDFLDVPLNNRDWLEFEIKRIQKIGARERQIQAIQSILNWENPGPGGFYDNLGDPFQQPHLLTGIDFERDPGFVNSAHVEFWDRANERLAWQCQAQTLFEAPLRMRYKNLDPTAQYTLRVNYHGRFHATMKLVANQKYVIHEAVKTVDPPRPLEFSIPHAATQTGELELTWYRLEGRGCQVAEVWLMGE